MTLSSISSTLIEDVASETNGFQMAFFLLISLGTNLWFQLYVFTEREFSLRMVRRAEAAGYKALLITVDAPTSGKRERGTRESHSPSCAVCLLYGRCV